MQKCYILASSAEEINLGLTHFRNLTIEDCIARASYSAYNGGPEKISRYRTPLPEPIDYKTYPFANSNGYDKRYINFWNIYHSKAWK